MTDAAKLTLKYDPLTIKHLGVSLYSQLPSVLSEMVSNAFDADAEKVEIELYDDGVGKSIRINDDGHGMSFNEINDKYLLVGRNRRSVPSTTLTPKKKRKVIGKKGLGKLSVFGICTEIQIKTTKDGIQNEFQMDLNEIEKKAGEYYPVIISLNQATDDVDGTEIWLKKIKRKSPFNIDSIVTSLAKKFTLFDEMKTSISLNDAAPIVLTNEMKFAALDVEYEWKFPDDKFDDAYLHWKHITGKIITPKTPLKDTSMKGIYLISRGKIVNEAEFYGARDNDHVHAYMTGYLNIDFIDELDDDIISTDRLSLIWENDQANSLRLYLQEVIKKVGSEWKTKRKNAKEEKVSTYSGKSISDWKKDLPSYEKDLADKIIDPVLLDPKMEIEQSSSIISEVMDKFENKAYKDYASNLADTLPSTELPKIISLFNEWKITERKELSDLAIARIQVIKKFEELLDNDTKEVPTLHDFLKKFSWLLDPRVLEFRDEVTYSKLLKETFPDETLDEPDRRIDFLCSNVLGGVLYVVEIKRSKYRVDEKALEQAYGYGAFLNEKYATDSGFTKVVCYVVGGEKSSTSLFRAKENTYRSTGEVFVKTYRELLEQSKAFHQEFIDANNATTVS